MDSIDQEGLPESELSDALRLVELVVDRLLVVGVAETSVFSDGADELPRD